MNGGVNTPWNMTAHESMFLATLPDPVQLYYVGDGQSGTYYLTKESAQDAMLAYAYRDVVTRMWSIDISRHLICAVDLERGVAQVAPTLEFDDVYVGRWLREKAVA